MCIQLRKGNHLDCNLMPTIKKYLPEMRNAHLALNLNKSDSYEMKVKPSLWERTRGTLPEELFLTVFKLDTPGDLDRPSQPLALLTRTAMPNFAPIPLYLQAGKITNVMCTSTTKAFKTTILVLEKLNTFTLRMYKDIYNKTFEVNIPRMSYWLAPIIDHEVIDKDTTSPYELIDWQLIDYVYRYDERLDDIKDAEKWPREMPDPQLENRFLVDRWSGARRFFSVSIDKSLKPQSPVPEGTHKAKYMDNILDYTISLYPKSKERWERHWNPEQPVLNANVILHRLNYLDDFSGKEEKPNTSCYVCPQPLLFSPVCLLSKACPHSG